MWTESVLGQGLLWGSFKRGNEPPVSTKDGKFFDQLSSTISFFSRTWVVFCYDENQYHVEVPQSWNSETADPPQIPAEYILFIVLRLKPTYAQCGTVFKGILLQSSKLRLNSQTSYAFLCSRFCALMKSWVLLKWPRWKEISDIEDDTLFI